MSEEYSENDNYSSSAIALRQYEILRQIFSHLPMRDVKTFARVNKLWNEVSNRERRCERSRLKPVTFSFEFPSRPVNFYFSAPFGLTQDELKLYSELRRFVSEMRIDPEAAIIFSTGDSEDLSCGENGSYPGFHLNTDEVDRILPTQCVSISTTVSGVVCTQENGEVVEVENFISPPEILNAVSIAFLPRSQGSKVVPFEVGEIPSEINDDLEGLQESNPGLSKADILSLFTMKLCGFRLDPEDKIKCLLMLTNAHSYPSALKIINSLGRTTNRQIAVGGGVGSLSRCSLSAQTFKDLVIECNGDVSSYLKTTGLIVAGENIKAASVVIPDKTKPTIEAAIRKLKAYNFDESRSVAFAFICCARGKYFFRQDNVEASIFRQVFPRVPLVGGFCGGEIGIDYVPNDNGDPVPPVGTAKKARLDRIWKDRELRHSFTTVLVMLCYE